jgi:hypothetical protein
VVVPESITTIQVAFVQAGALYGSGLWWDPKDVGRRNNLQLLFNQQTRSVMGTVLPTPKGALMRAAGLTPMPLILDSRHQRFGATLANTCSCKLKALHEDPLSSTAMYQVIETEHEHGGTTTGMSWEFPGEEPVVKTMIREGKSIANRSAQSWAREREAKVWVGV